MRGLFNTGCRERVRSREKVSHCMDAQHNEDSFPFLRSENMQERCMWELTPGTEATENEPVAAIRSSIDTQSHLLPLVW